MSHANLKSAVTREAAIVLTAHRPSLRWLESEGRNLGFAVSKNALNRAVQRRWDAHSLFSCPIVEFSSTYLAEEHSHEYGDTQSTLEALALVEWFKLNHRDPALLSAQRDNDLWRVDEEHARMIITQYKSSSLIHNMVTASAQLHLARNPRIEDNERSESRNKAIDLLEEAFSDIEQDYRDGFAIVDILEKERQDLLALPNFDITGLFLSTALHLLNMGYADRGMEFWKSFLVDLSTKGLFPHLVVRGLLMKEPQSLMNAAEAAFIVNRHNEAERIVILALSVEPNLHSVMSEKWSKALEHEFVHFAANVLSEEARKKE